MAQVYNHMILPLAGRRDRITQIRWGIADYENNYGAPPEGMWLAETAADTDSLELLAQHGIKFTLLAPHQCKRIRPLNPDTLAPIKATENQTLDQHPRRFRRHHPSLPRPFQVWREDRCLLLQRTRLPSHRV